MTPQEIRQKFEHGAPDRYLAFYEAILEIMSGETTCDAYKQQRIGIILGAAQVGRECWESNNTATTTI